MKRILSGVQATGLLHIGNYLGALKPWAQLQTEGEAFYFIPNLHSLNVRPEPNQLMEATLGNVAWLMSVGIDPAKSLIYAQSQISAHSELFGILNNFVTMGELSRMTQYKDKNAQWGAAGQLVGLFEYPVLMAADILLYDADLVPTGQDQKQHVELTRDIAERFNKLYGPTFTVPKPYSPKVAARVMSLQDPAVKMSKSDPNEASKIMLLDKPEVITAKVMKAVTDSDSGIKAAPNKPAISNLLEIYSGLSDRPVADIEVDYEGKGYGQFKKDLAELTVATLSPLQESYHELMADQKQLLTILEQGKEKASTIANVKLAEVKAKLGLL